jgi:DmsE family decaheme c-type cytochrome
MKKRSPFSILRAGLAAAAFIGLLASGPAQAQAVFDQGPLAPGQVGATYVGEKVCAKCHDAENGHFGHTLHAKTFRDNPKNELQKLVCEACHGPGSKHAANTNEKNRDTIVGFSREWGTPVDTMNGRCLGCHSGGQRMYWPGSIHQVNKLACSDCHNPMARFSTNGLLKKASITETCQTCHQQQRAEFRKRSHMPVPEGKMTCEDCHNPHGSATKRLLKADTVNELCYTCHAEKRGPYIWEHAPVRENCLNCHYPHGSNQDKLLVAARPVLCQGCHSGSGNMGHQLFGMDVSPALSPNNTSPNSASGTSLAGGARFIGRSCQNCHSQIHGSNSPSGARFQR